MEKMELKVYSKDTAYQRAPKIQPSEIRFYRSGAIWITNKALEHLGAEVGDMVLVGQNKKKPSEWFLWMIEEGNGMALRAGKASKGALTIQHSASVRDIFAYMKKTTDDTNSISFTLGYEHIEYQSEKLFPIIIGSSRIQPRKERKKRKPKAA